METVLLDKRDIREMVLESVKKVLAEKRGVVDEGIKQLCSYISNWAAESFKNHQSNDFTDKFIIPAEEVDKYNKYFKSSLPLTIVIGGTSEDKFGGEYEKGTNTITISNQLWDYNTWEFLNKTTIREVLSHELTHMVNLNMFANKTVAHINQTELCGVNISNDIRYLFSNTEMTARINGFAQFLEIAKPLKIIRKSGIAFDEVTRVKKMEEYINLLKSLRYEDENADIIRQLFYMDSVERKSNTQKIDINKLSDKDENGIPYGERIPYMKTEMPEDVWNRVKEKIIRNLEKKLSLFQQKIAKVFWDYCQSK